MNDDVNPDRPPEVPEYLVCRVAEALGLASDAELVTELDIHRSTLWGWKRRGIPPRRRFELAAMLRQRAAEAPPPEQLRMASCVLALLQP